MINCNLAAAGNVSVEASNINSLTSKNRSILNIIKQVITNFDRKAQSFLNAQAIVRARKPLEAKWGIERDAGFF